METMIASINSSYIPITPLNAGDVEIILTMTPGATGGYVEIQIHIDATGAGIGAGSLVLASSDALVVYDGDAWGSGGPSGFNVNASPSTGTATNAVSIGPFNQVPANPLNPSIMDANWTVGTATFIIPPTFSGTVSFGLSSYTLNWIPPISVPPVFPLPTPASNNITITTIPTTLSITTPSITGLASATEAVGYSNTHTGSNSFTITAAPMPTSSQVFVTTATGSPDDPAGAITWNHAESRLDIAAGLPVGVYVVEITVDTDFGLPGTIEFTFEVEEVAVTGVNVNPTTLNMVLGVTAPTQLTETVAPSNATNQDVVWSSDTPAVATVDANGVVTAVSEGTAIITVTTVDGGFTATTNVTVTSAPIPVTGITINQSNIQLVEGANLQLTTTITPTNATNQAVTWTSGDSSVATVSATGEVLAVAPGTAVITVTTQDGGHIATVTITVTPAPTSTPSVTTPPSATQPPTQPQPTPRPTSTPTPQITPTPMPHTPAPAATPLADVGLVITVPEQEQALEETEDIVVEIDDILTITFPLEVIEQLTSNGYEVEDIYLQVVVWPPTGGNEDSNEPFELSVELSITRVGEAVTEVDIPIVIEVNLSDFDLEELLTDFHPMKVIAVLEDGTLVLGEFEAETGIFSFATTAVGNFAVEYAPTLRIIGLEIGSYDIMNVIPNELLLVMEDMTPIIQSNRTLIPLRFVAYVLDASVSWNSAERTVTIVRGGQVLTFAIGEMAPGMDVPAQIMNNRTMVPLRFIAEFFDATTVWDSYSRSILIIQR